jgi:hypothetical protein
MRKSSIRFGSLAAACAVAFVTREMRAQFASSVIFYNPGTGAAAGYNDATTALGMPSTFTNDPNFPGPVDPFDPPYLTSQIVSIGAGGSLTVQFGAPILNSPANPFGLDFIVYGNAGFAYSDFNAGITGGDLFGAATPGSTRVSVSADNVTYFTLDTSLAPTVDTYFPTDGAGTFGFPVDPSRANAASFNGMNLNQIRSQYAGSAGGTGFDLDWARDASGIAVPLDAINFVRVEVLSGKAEIDGLAAVPEPSTWALLGLGAGALLLRKCRA